MGEYTHEAMILRSTLTNKLKEMGVDCTVDVVHEALVRALDFQSLELIPRSSQSVDAAKVFRCSPANGMGNIKLQCEPWGPTVGGKRFVNVLTKDCGTIVAEKVEVSFAEELCRRWNDGEVTTALAPQRIFTTRDVVGIEKRESIEKALSKFFGCDVLLIEGLTGLRAHVPE